MDNCISLRIKEVREKAGLNKVQFSELLKMDNGQYGRVEKGIVQITIAQMLDIQSNFPDTDLHWLLTGQKFVDKKGKTTQTEEMNANVARVTNEPYQTKSILEIALEAQQQTIELQKEKIERLEADLSKLKIGTAIKPSNTKV